MNLISFFVSFVVLLALSGCGGRSPKPVTIGKYQYYPDSRCNQKQKTIINVDRTLETANRGRIQVSRGDAVCYTGDINNHPYIHAIIKPFNVISPSASEIQKKQESLNRISQYEVNYLKEHDTLVKSFPERKSTYIQPVNKKEQCKLYMSYAEGNKYFEDDESYKIFWDGSCKNGFASGLGREIEKADMVDKWGIAIYKKGLPAYYVIKNNLTNSLYEGIYPPNEDGYFYAVETVIKEQVDDIEVNVNAGARDWKNASKLIATTSPFYDGVYVYIKDLGNFQYIYRNAENSDDPQEQMNFEFFLANKDGKNGWMIGRGKNNNIFTGEYINNKFSLFDLPKTYNEKGDQIIKEIDDAQRKAKQAQEYSRIVKEQYKKKICKDTVKVNFMNNEDYKAICSDKKDIEVLAKINKKLTKLAEDRIARLEQQKFTQQQAKEEQHRQQTLELERQKLTEIQRHNREQESAASTANFNQSMKNLTEQINNMTPKTYNLNVFHY